MIDRETIAAQLFVAIYTRTTDARGHISDPKADEIAVEAMAASQTLASLACRHFGHPYGGEGTMHEHECSRCGGDISSLVNADHAAWKESQNSARSAAASYFQPRRVYIGDCD